MSNWTMAEAKKDYSRGLLRGVRLVDTGLDTWGVQIESTLGMDGVGWLIDAKKKEARQCKTLDAAVAAVKEIGFTVKQLEVVDLTA